MCDTLRKLLKRVDAYGQPIQLTYKNATTFKTSYGGICTLLSRGVLLLFLVLQFKLIVDKKAAIDRQINSTDVVRTPDNFTMNYTNFQMAAKINFQVNKQLDMRRYYRVIYGPEYYTWVKGDFQIVLENREGIKCQRSMFNVSDEEWDSFNLSVAYCPVIEENFYISG